MTFQQVIAELREKFPRAILGPTAIRGESFDRAAVIDFKKSKSGMYKGQNDEHDLVVYYNDTEHIICCTEGVHEE